MKRKLIELANQRTALVQTAEEALTAGNTAEYDSTMEQIRNLNTEMSRINDLLAEQERQAVDHLPTGAELRDMAEERGHALMQGHEVTFTQAEIRRAITNDTTLASGQIVEPTGAGANIRDPLGSQPSSILDQVLVTDLTGMGSFLEPYVITELDAKTGKVKTNAGKARTASTSPTFGVAKISPFEVNVTDFVDRNISRLSPANYYAKVYAMAMRAMRREIVKLIANGDGQASPDMFGVKTAKNTDGNVIFASVNVAAVDRDLLDKLFFAYGSDEAIGQNARLYLTKADLAAISKLRADDGRKLYRVEYEPGNPNVGVITGDCSPIPYTILPALTSLSAADTAAEAQTMLYGDPMNYELGLFGGYTVRVDESVKAVERMVAILGDVMVGGNLIVDKGFVVATKAAG